MKTFLVGLAITVIGGLILSYIQNINIIILLTNTTSWIYSLLVKVFDFCISILTFNIPIWFIICAIFLILIIVKFRNNYLKENKKSLYKQYNELPDNEQKIFNIILMHNEQRKKCTYNNILKMSKHQQLNTSNLETQQVLENLITKSFIYHQSEWMDEPHYLLSNPKGRDLAVELIKNTKDKE